MRQKVLIVAAVAVVTVLVGAYVFLSRGAEENDPLYGPTPFLRVSLPQHTGTIMRAGMTADGNTLVTISRDDTIKLWSVRDMQLMRTLRVPISSEYANNPGVATLTAVDISPDGSRIAVGGRVTGDGTARVLVLDTVTGDALDDPLTAKGHVSDITFSTDGAYVAASIFGDGETATNGVWVWRVGEWARPVMHDADYGGRISGMRFSRTGALVTTSFDGHLRRYADPRSQTAPTAKVRVWSENNGPGPYDIEFSPDETQVVVSFLNVQDGDNPAAVNTYDAATFELKREFDVRGLSDGAGGRIVATAATGVRFSRSGRYLYASLFANADNAADEIVRRWSVDGSAASRDIPTCTDQTVNQILPYGRDGAVLVNTVPCITVIDDAGQIQQRTTGLVYPVYNYDLTNEDPGHLMVSRRGDTFFLAGKDPGSGIWFDLRRREIIHANQMTRAQRAALAHFNGYRVSAGAMRFRNWADTQAPYLDTQAAQESAAPLEITNNGPLRGNHSFSVDVAESGEFGVLGGLYDVRRYNSDGQSPWQRFTAELVMRTNITPDGNVVLLYYQNGVMEWRDAATGDVVLNLFIDAQGDRYVIWTPQGYYTGSPGADDLIGWHLNHGRLRAPSWEPASRYQDQFRRTDVIDAVVNAMVTGENTRDVIASANSGASTIELVRAQAPPVALIHGAEITDGEGAPSVAVRFSIRSPSGRPITGVRIDVDGRTPINEEHAFEANRIYTRTVPVAEGDRNVIVVGRTGERNWGAVAYARVDDAILAARGAETGEAAIELPPPPPAVLHALVVGINRYQPSDYNLQSLTYAEADAIDFARYLRAQAGQPTLIYSQAQVNELIGQRATLRAISEGLSQLRRAEAKDVILIYLAGHGLRVNERYYFVPSDTSPAEATINQQAITGDDIANLLEHSRARGVLILDTCRAYGAIDTTLATRAQNVQREIFAFTASSGQGVARERSELGHGLYTYALLQALNGTASDFTTRNRIRASVLNTHITEFVMQRTNNQQEPRLWARRSDGSVPDAELFSVTHGVQAGPTASRRR